MIEKIKDIFGKISFRVGKGSEEDIATLRAKVVKLQREKKKLEEQLKKTKEVELAKEVEKKREKLLKRRKIIYTEDLRGKPVITKDSVGLGNFYDFAIVDGRFGVITEKNGKKYLVWEAKDIDSLFHRPDRLSEAEVLVVNRDKEGNFIPDIEVEVTPEDCPKDVPKEYLKQVKKMEDYIGELTKRISKLESENEALRKAVGEQMKKAERWRRNYLMEHFRADDATAIMKDISSKYIEMFREHNKLVSQLTETTLTLSQLKKENEVLWSVIERIRSRLEELLPKHELEAMFEEVSRLKEHLK